MQMVLTPNDLFSWNNKYSKYKDILLCYIHYNRFIARLPSMHTDLLCACWYFWAVKGSSSSSSCRLLISLKFTSCLLLSPKLTDAPYPDPGALPPLLFSRWRLHSQEPRILPSQGTRQFIRNLFRKIQYRNISPELIDGECYKGQVQMFQLCYSFR
jgi:hypothetical protein